jgi:CO/xanthine dehydrogenase FAD-binding subunit
MVNGYFPLTLAEALNIRGEVRVVPYAGGTDLMIKGQNELPFLYLNKLNELHEISSGDSYYRIGAACTFTEIIDHPEAPEVLKAAVKEIGAPAIRNLGTVGGNICTGSPKADSALMLYAVAAMLRLQSARGERIIPISDFHLGRGKTSLGTDELLTEVLIPRRDYKYYFKKVGARKALAISRVSFAGVFEARDGVITNCAAAFGAISDTVFRSRETEAMLLGKTVAEAKALKPEILAAYDALINPIRGRVSEKYRKTVCRNLLSDFLSENGI